MAGTSVKRREGDHADRLGGFRLRLSDQLVPQVFARECDGPAIVVLDDLVLPEKSRGSAEYGPTKDETLSDQVIEQAKRLGTQLAADHHLKIFRNVSLNNSQTALALSRY